MNYPFISIIIPVFNEERYLAHCLKSLEDLEYPPDKLETILVDNGSTDRSLLIASEFDVAIFVKKKVNVGAVRNYGVSQSIGEFVVFLDADCTVEPRWLRDGLELAQKEGGVAGGLYLLRDDPSWVELGWVLRSSRNFTYQKTLVGGCIFIKKDTFVSIGGFDERLSAGEDTDLNNRLVKAGATIAVSSRLSVVHLGYPNTIRAFMKRQMWHSEDYWQRLARGDMDAILLITILFLSCLITIMLCLFFSGPIEIVIFCLFGLILCPMILTVKRAWRYQLKVNDFKLISLAYILDCFYLLGRTIGVFRSVRRGLFKSKIKKISGDGF